MLSATVLTLSALMALASPSQDFDRGRVAFGRGEYLRAIELLRPLLYPELRLETEGEVVQAHRMLGVANLFEGRPAEAKVEFRKLLELRPDYRFDPLLDPPRVVDFFNSVVKDEEDEIAALEAKRKKQESERAAQRRQEAERLRIATAKVIVYDRHSYLLNFVPFGAGQFQNGQRRKGLAFAGTEAGLGLVSLGAFVANFWLFGLEPGLTPTRHPNSTKQSKANTILSIFWRGYIGPRYRPRHITFVAVCLTRSSRASRMVFTPLETRSC